MQSMPKLPKASSKQPTPKRRWRTLRFILGGPLALVGISEILQGAEFIGSVATSLKGNNRIADRISFHPDGRINVWATALLNGMSEEDMANLFAQRRREAARSAYLLFATGAIFFAAWIYAALQMPLRITRIVSAIEFLPFCALFFLLSFQNAWRNWQLRMMRRGSAGAYLHTTDPFLPR